MTSPRCYAAAWLALGLAVAPSAYAQPAMRIGYVYPAGGKQGTTFEAVIAGQFLTGVNNVYVSGGGVQATISELIQPIRGNELNRLRIQMDELLARKAVVTQNFKALEVFRSFKNAKNIKSGSDDDDREIAALKKKYAGAAWTREDDRLLQETRRKISSGVRRPANPAISELAVVHVTVAPDTKPGPRELRIATPAGLSNPLVFHVGQLAEFSEQPSKQIAEQRSAIAKAGFAPKNRRPEPEMEIALPAVINGQILPGAVDRFRFQARQGQQLVVAACARELIPYIADAVPGWFQATLAVYDAEGKELAYDDDYRFHPDPVLFCRIPADGQYVVEIKDAIYRGRDDFVYRIMIGELPFVTSIFPLGGPAGRQTTVELKGWNLPKARLVRDNTDGAPGIYPLTVRKGDRVSNAVPFAVDTLPESLEKEPNNKPQDAQPVSLSIIVNGRIGQPDDTDVFAFQGKAGQEIVAEVVARRLDSPLDSVLKLIDADGRQVAVNDDHEDRGEGLTTHHADSYLRATLPADGRYFVHLCDMQHKGGPEYAYRLRISPPAPDFELRVVPSSVTARFTATIPITVYALRKDGFAGDIAIALREAPEGCTLSGAWVPGSEDRARLTLTLPPSFSKEPFALDLEGRATIQGRPVVRRVVPAEDMIQAFEYRHLVPARQFEVARAGRAGFRMALKLPDQGPLRIAAGGTARVEFDAPMSRAMGKVQLELSEPPEGIAIKDVSSSRQGLEILLQTDAAKVKPGLKGNLIVVATRPGGAPAGKAKPAARRPAAVATLPAVPFEIVAQ